MKFNKYNVSESQIEVSKTKTARELNLRMSNEQSILVKFEIDVSESPFKNVVDSVTY